MQVPVAGLGARKTDGGRSGRSQRGSTLTLGKDEKLLDLLPFLCESWRVGLQKGSGLELCNWPELDARVLLDW